MSEDNSSHEGLRLVWPGKDQAPRTSPADLRVVERVPGADGSLGQPNRLIHGDNLAAADALLESHAGQVDLVYLDPPFATGARFQYAPTVPGRGRVARTAYRDSWGRGGMAAYLSMIYPRLVAARELLSPRGSLMVHADWRASSHLRLVLDEIFGPSALVNEIVWCYGGGGAPRRRYPRKHDTILWYARGPEWIFHRQFRPYTEGTRQRGLTQVKGPRYQLREEGAGLDDWWHGKETQKILSPTAHENLKYPTQKPEGLLRRIVMGHSDPGSLVADFFCGSGTTLAVAEQEGRRWIGCDEGESAVQVARKRLLCLEGRKQGFEVMVCVDDHDHGDGDGDGAIRVKVEQVEGGVRVVLEGYRAAAPELEGVHWTDVVDSWGVDWDHDGEVFELGWVSCNCRKDPGVVLSTPTHCYPGPGTCRIAVKVVDVLGGEATESVAIQHS